MFGFAGIREWGMDENLNLLGQGRFGPIAKGKKRYNQSDYAVKCCKRDYGHVTEKMREEMEKIEDVPAHIHNVNVLQYKEKIVSNENIKDAEMWVKMELCELGDLVQYARRQALSVVQKVDISLQCALGLQHLHHQRPSIAHGDVKPPSILISGDPERPVFKLGDFVASRLVELSPETILLGGATNTYYLAPEAFTEDRLKKPLYTASADVFSLSASCYSLLKCPQRSWIEPHTSECCVQLYTSILNCFAPTQ